MNAGRRLIHVFLFSALSPLGLSVSHGLGSGEDVAFMRRRWQRIRVQRTSHEAYILVLANNSQLYPRYSIYKLRNGKLVINKKEGNRNPVLYHHFLR